MDPAAATRAASPDHSAAGSSCGSGGSSVRLVTRAAARLIEHRSRARFITGPPVPRAVRWRARRGPGSGRHRASARGCAKSFSAAVQRLCRVGRDERAPAHEVQRKTRANTGAHAIRRIACAPERFRARKTSAAARTEWRFRQSSAAVREKRRRSENFEEFCLGDRELRRLFSPFQTVSAQNAPGWWRTCVHAKKTSPRSHGEHGERQRSMVLGIGWDWSPAFSRAAVFQRDATNHCAIAWPALPRRRLTTAPGVAAYKRRILIPPFTESSVRCRTCGWNA